MEIAYALSRHRRHTIPKNVIRSGTNVSHENNRHRGARMPTGVASSLPVERAARSAIGLQDGRRISLRLCRLSGRL
jgi:hypothetical protein